MDTVSWTFVIVFGVAFVVTVTYSIIDYIRNNKKESKSILAKRTYGTMATNKKNKNRSPLSTRKHGDSQ